MISQSGFFTRRRFIKFVKFQFMVGIAFLLSGFFIYSPQSPIANKTKFTQISEVHAASSGPNVSSTIAAAGGTATGTCTDNTTLAFSTASANANDSSFSTIGAADLNWDNNNITNEIRFSNFGFSIPTGASIDGILVEQLAWTTAGSGQFSQVQLFTAPGSNVGNNNGGAINMPSADPGSSYTSFGSSSDQWGRTWTAAEVSASTFGVALCYKATAANSKGQLDHLRITITYTPFTISGTCKTENESSNCPDGESVRFAINGTLASTGADTTATTSSGAFTITPATIPASGNVITVFINGVADDLEAVAVTKWDGSGAITGINLIEGSLSIGSDDNQSLTNTNLGSYDGSVSADEDIFFDNMSAATCDGQGSFTGLCADYGNAGTGQFSNTEQIHIKASNTYAPGGNVRTGKLDIRGTYTGASETLALTGAGTTDSTCTATTDMPLCKASGGTFTATTNIVSYISTTATNIAIDSITYSTIEFKPTSGSPTYTLGDASSQTLTATTVNIGNASNAVTVQGTSNNPAMSISGVLTIAASAIFNTGTGTITLSGTGTPLVVDGTFTATSGNTVTYTNTTSATIKATTYHHLNFLPASGTPTYTLGAGTLNVNGDLTLNGSGVETVTGVTNDPTITVTGNVVINGTDTFIAPDAASNIITVGGNWTNASIFTHNNNTVKFTATDAGNTIAAGSSSFFNVTFDGSGGEWTPITNTMTIAGDLTMTNGSFNGAGGTPANVSVSGDVKCGATCGTINFTSTNTFTQNVTVAKNFGTNVAVATNWSFNNLTFTGTSDTITTSSTGTGTITVAGALTISSTTTLDAANRTWILSGTSTPISNSGTFTASTSTFQYTGATATLTGLTFNNLTLGGTGTYTLPAADITMRGNLVVTTGATVTKSASNKIIFAKGGGGTQTITSNAIDSDLGIVQVSANAGATTVNMSSSITVTTLTIDTSQIFSVNGSNTLTLTGTGGSVLVATGATFTASTGTVIYNGDGDATIAAVAYNNLTLSPTLSSSRNYTLNATTIGGNFIINPTKFTTTSPLTVTLSAALVVTGTTTVTTTGTAASELNTAALNSYAFTTGGLTVSSGGLFTANNSTITNTGNWSIVNASSFEPGQSTVVFTPATSANITGETVFYNLTISPGKTVNFEKHTGGVPVFTVQNTMLAQGTIGNPITIQSTQDGTQWKVHFDLAQGASNFTYVSLKDSGCDAGSAVADMSGTGNSNVSGNDTTCWSFVSGITISGSADGNGNAVVKVAYNSIVQGTAGTVNAGGTSWTISGIAAPGSGAVVTVWVDAVTDSSESTAVTKYDGTGDITGMVLNINVLTIGSADNQSLTVPNLDNYDCTNDEDVMHLVYSSTELQVQGGESTCQGSINNSYSDETISVLTDSTLVIDTTETLLTDNLLNSGTISAQGSSAINVSGNWADTGTFESNTGTVAFTATDTGHTINNGASSFYNLTFNGNGGGWSNSAAMTVDNDLVVTAGTLSGTNDISVIGGDVTGNGTINLTGGTLSLDVNGGNFGGDTAWTFNNLTFGDGSSTTNIATGTGSITISGVLTIAADQTLNAGSKTWILSNPNSATPFDSDQSGASCTCSSAHFQYTGDNDAGNVNVENLTYNHLTLGGATAENYVPEGAVIVSNDLTLNANGTLSGTQNVTVSGAATGDGAINLTGGTFTHSVTSSKNFGGDTAWTFSTLVLTGDGGTTAATGTGGITVSSVLNNHNQHTLNAGSKTWTLSGTGTPFVASGTFTASTSTFVFTGNGASISPVTYNNLELKPSSSTAQILPHNTVGQYTNFSFDTAASGNTNPRGIVEYNGFFWVVDITAAEVFKYNVDGTYTGTSFDTSAVTTAPLGITYYNGFFWIVSQTDTNVYRYNTDGTGGVFAFDTAASGNTSPRGITYYNGFFWITDGTLQDVYRYNTDGTGGAFNFDTGASGNTTPRGIASANGSFWISELTGQKAYKYNSDGSSAGVNFNVTTTTAQNAPGYYNNALWVTDINNSGEVWKYNIGTFAVNGNLTIGDGTNAGATAATNNPSFTVGGNVTVAANATFTAPAGTLTISGNFTVNGTFTHNSGTVVFNGAGTSEIDGNTTAFNNFTVTTAGKALRFKQSETVQIVGALTLTGANGNNITLDSIDGSTQWTIDHDGTESISYITVTRSACDGTSSQISVDNGTNTNGGSNGACWVFAAAGVTISGIVYTNDETTVYGTITAMKLSVNGGTAYTTNSTVTTGVFSFTSVTTPSNGDILTIWLNTDGSGGVQGSLVLKYGASCTGTPDCTGLKVVRDQVRLENMHTGDIVTTDLAACDNDTDADCSDADIGFTANSGVMTTTWATNELKIASGDTYAPGGNIAVQKLDVAGTYTGSTETLTISGSGSNSTCTNSAQMPLCVGGTFTAPSTVKYTGTSATTVAGTNVDYVSLGIRSDSDSNAGATFTLGGNTTVSGILTIGHSSSTNANTLDASSRTLTLSGTGTPLVIAGSSKGVFTPSTSTVQYTGSSSTITATEFNNLTLGGTGTYTLPNSNFTLRGNVVVTSGATVNKGTGTLIFASGGTQTVTDNNATKQDLGSIQVSSDAGGGYSYYRTITIDHTKVPSTQNNFPVLISGTYDGTGGIADLRTTGNGGRVTSSSGYDIIFSSNSSCSAPLSHEIETYNASTGVVNFWVKMTVTNPSDAVVYMCYGNSSITTSQEDKAGVWSSSFEGVWHLPNGSSLSAVNSVTNTAATITGATATTGKVDGAASFVNNVTDKIATDVTSVNNTNTHSIWTYRTGDGGNNLGRIIQKGASTVIMQLNNNSAGTYDFTRGFATDGVWTFARPTANAWHYIVITYDSSSLSNDPVVYVDGQLVTVTEGATQPAGARDDSAEVYNIGNRANGNDRNWGGNLDEYRIANAIRSADWVTAEWNNQNSPSTFYSIGSEQTVTSGDPSTLNLGSSLKVTSATVDAGQTLSVNGSNTLTITGTGTPLAVSGTFNPSTGTVSYTNSVGATVAATNYYNLEFAPTAGDQDTLTLVSANLQKGRGTDDVINQSRQVTALAGIGGDIWAIQERNTGDTGWDSSLSTAGYAQAVYLENAPSQGDGPAIWYKTSTVTIEDTYSKALYTGVHPLCTEGQINLGRDCSTDVRKSAVAAKVTVAGKTFYVVSTHLCWSACWDSNVLTTSVQRVNQINDLLSWIDTTLTGGLDVFIIGDMNFAPDYPKSPSGVQLDLFTGDYDDLWQVALAEDKASAPWGDRDSNGQADMPIGNLTTRTLDSRRIDYFFLNNNSVDFTLNSMSLPDLRATCSQALVNGVCTADVVQTIGFSEDAGVKPSDHNWIKTVLDVNSSPTYTLAGGTLAVSNNFTIAGTGDATIDANTNDPAITVGGSFTVGSGDAFSASSSASLTVTGNFVNNGTFTHNNGSVVLTPTLFSNVDGSSDTTFYNFNIANQGGKTVKFKNGKTFGITNSLTATGSSSSTLYLVSMSSGSQWTINYTGSTATLEYVLVQDSACSGNNITLNQRVIDGGNNGNCWRFPNFGRGNGNGGSGGGSGGGTPPGGGTGQGGGSGGTGGSSGGGPILPETFTNSDGVALATHNASWTVNAGNFAINTNSVYANGAGNGYSMAIWNQSSFSNDQYAEITLPALTSGGYIGVVVRGQSGSFSGYIVVADSVGSSVLRCDAGTCTLLTSGGVFSQGDTLRLEASGTSITLKKNGSVLAGVTDATYSSGRPGLAGYSNVTGSRGDNFNAASISLGGGGGGSP
jgi:endonuclease/exonuclease/phosphatase family metal-dependent hydrolase